MPATSSNEASPRDSFGTSDHIQGPARKKMRKGTKSCLECRRRKIKCTFEPGRTQVCNECYARGSTCIDQEHGDIQTYTQNVGEQSSYSLRERVTQLEDLVKQVLYRLPEKEDATEGVLPQERTQVDTQAAEVLKSLRHDAPLQHALATEESVNLPAGLRDDAPALTLFDNAVIARKDTQPVISRSQYNKAKTVIGALNQLLPSMHDLEIILEWSSAWWAIWRKMFPNITDRRCSSIRESVSHSLRSEKPAEVAKITLCIAISIHQMPPTFDWSKLEMKEDPSEYMERCINVVNRLITSDEEICATIEGVECIILEAKYHVNMGRPRRAWLLFRRGIAFSELLGLHRLSMTRPANPDPEHQKAISIWGHIVLGDRWLSLILGLPYSVPEALITPLMPFVSQVCPGNSEGEAYAGLMTPIMTRIIDRNQNPTPLPFSASLRLDQDLEELHSKKDPSWWTTRRLEGSTIEDHFDRLSAQFFHHHARLLIHLPFMLKSSTNKRFQYSHNAALEAAREMIRYYDALRSDKSVGPYVCKLLDFQAFTAGMLLLLNLCGYSQQSRGPRSQEPDLESDQQDSELIDLTVSLLQEASKEAGGVVATQSARALEMLGQARHGCAEGNEDFESCRNETCQVSIPYFGTISVTMGKHFVLPKPGTYAPTRHPTYNAQNPANGLPTPPSLGTLSCQQSPMSANTDSAVTPNAALRQHSTQSQPGPPRLPNYESTDFIAPGLGSQPWPDDPLITFDSFMPLPATMDYSGAGDFSGSVSSSGWTPGSFPGSGPGTAGGMSGVGANIAGNGNNALWENGLQGTAPLTAFPFGNVELDQGWWFGVDNPVL